MRTDEERLQYAMMCEQLKAIQLSYSELYREHERLKESFEFNVKKAWDEGYRAGVDDERDIPL